MKEDFDKSLTLVFKNIKNLEPIYRDNIKLINLLKSQAKNYMKVLADLDSGFDSKSGPEEEDDLKDLLNSIDRFNDLVDEQVNQFSREFDILKENFEKVVSCYSGDKGELSSLLKLRKQLLYFMMMLGKFKLRIKSLQLMNNALFTFSSEFKSIESAYKSNLIKVSTCMLEAEENGREVLKKIEKLD